MSNNALIIGGVAVVAVVGFVMWQSSQAAAQQNAPPAPNLGLNPTGGAMSDFAAGANAFTEALRFAGNLYTTENERARAAARTANTYTSNANTTSNLSGARR